MPRQVAATPLLMLIISLCFSFFAFFHFSSPPADYFHFSCHLLSFCILLLIYFAITIHAARHAAFFFFFRRPRYFMLDFRH